MMTLPKFLLAWSDFNWLWVFARLRPAKNMNWTILRALALTFFSALAGGALGLVLGVVIYGHPVGWLPWLMGLILGCTGLCWFGVTALCWNQRAARLRADPASPCGLPKARYPFFRWCLGFIYYVILGILTPLALVVTIENIRGEIAWKKERARLEAAGEKLTFDEILGPEIPASQNAGAAEIFAPFFDYKYLPTKQAAGNGGEPFYVGNVVWSQSNRVADLEHAFITPGQYLPDSAKGSRSSPTTPLINLTNWSAAYRAAAKEPRPGDVAWPSALKLPPPGDPARDVLAGLSRADHDLEQVCAAAALPHAQFPIHYDEAFEALLRDLAFLKGVQQTLQLRCAAHLAAGDSAAAFSDATNAINVAELLREEPLLISQLVRYAQLNFAINTVWQGLAEHRWSDSQLEFFQRRLAEIDCLPGIVLAFEGERAGGILALNRMIQDVQFYNSLTGEGLGLFRFMRALPRSVLRQNQVTLVRFQSQQLAELRTAIAQSQSADLPRCAYEYNEFAEQLASSEFSPYTLMLKMLLPVTGKVIHKTARSQSTIQMAIVACALERYRLANGEFPENLQQLAPKYGEIPLDPMVNEPFHYQRTDDGWFRLYSVGVDGDDDDGRMASGQQDDKEADWPWPVPTRPEHPRLF